MSEIKLLITLKEIQDTSRRLEELGMELKEFKLYKKIDLVQLNNEFEVYKRSNRKVVTFIQFVEDNYLDAVMFLIKSSTVQLNCFDQFWNLNEEIFFVRNSKGHVVSQALNFINFIYKKSY